MNTSNNIAKIANNNVFSSAGLSNVSNVSTVPWKLIAGICAVIGVLILIAMALRESIWESAPWWGERATAPQHAWDWLDIFRTKRHITDSGSLQEIKEPERMPGAPATSSVSERNPKNTKKETWCFVGEDLTGRFCVKVPSESSCDSERSYPSRSGCELQNANHMPAGIPKNGGIDLQPLRSMNIE